MNPFARRRSRPRRSLDAVNERDEQFRTYKPVNSGRVRGDRLDKRPRQRYPGVHLGVSGPEVPCGGQERDGTRCEAPVPPGRTVCNSCARRAFEDLWRSDVYIRSEIIDRIAVDELEARIAVAEEERAQRVARKDRLRRRDQAEQREREGLHVVYYVRTAPKRVKVGYTSDIHRRLREYRSDLSYLLAIEPGHRDLEQQRHHELRKWRVTANREDYAEGPEVAQRIAEVLAEYGDPRAWLTAHTPHTEETG